MLTQAISEEAPPLCSEETRSQKKFVGRRQKEPDSVPRWRLDAKRAAIQKNQTLYVDPHTFSTHF